MSRKVEVTQIVLLTDVGINMKQIRENNKSDFDTSKEIIDWIISRKIFSSANDQFTIISSGSEMSENDFDYEGIYVHNKCFEKASFNHLKTIKNDIQQNPTDFKSNTKEALKTAIAQFVDSEDEAPVDNRTVIFLTNNGYKELKNEDIEYLQSKFVQLDIELIIIGISEDEECGLANLAELVSGQVYSFENMLSNISNYIVKETEGRTYTKQWEIAPSIKLPVAFATKSSKVATQLKFSLVDEFGEKVLKSRKVVFENENGEKETMIKSSKANPNYNDDIAGFDSEQFCYGYNFGKDLIFFDENEIKNEYNNHNFNEGEKGGCLKLIQFTKLSNLSPSYYIGDKCHVVIPSVNAKKFDEASLRITKCTISMMNAMHQLNVAAICRYAFHASSHLKLMALVAKKDEESGALYFRAFPLPFSDDLKNVKFSSMEDEDNSTKPTVSQWKIMEDFIDEFTLEEGCVAEGKTLDYLLQSQCEYLKRKCLQGGDDIQKDDSIKIDDLRQNLLNKMKEEFNLQKVEKQRREKAELEHVDLDSLIDEIKQKSSEEATNKKKTKNLKKEIDIESKFEESAENALKSSFERHFELIRGLGSLPDSVTKHGFLMVIANEMKNVRMLAIKYKVGKEFNEQMNKIKMEAVYEDFLEFLEEEKLVFPISNKEDGACGMDEDDCAQFWDES